MSKHRWTGYVIEGKAVIKDKDEILTILVQMDKGLTNTHSWVEWITFCLNYWEKNYKSYTHDGNELVTGWSQVKVIKP
jgi:hypothetical protein